MAYVLPQTRVFQEFERASVRTARERYAHISAPHAHLVRYTEADEKGYGVLGIYNTTGMSLGYPGLPAGAIVDSSYTKMHIDNGLLRYFTCNGDSAKTIQVSGVRKLDSADLYFTTANDVDHSTEFKDRGVKVGDIVKVRYTNGSIIKTLWSYVAGFEYELEAAVVGSATADAGNQGTVTATSSSSFVDGVENCVIIDSLSHTAYNGLRTGQVSDTYSVTVVQGSTDGDPTTAILRVSSESGNDDVAELVPSAWGVATAIGTRGLTATFDLDTGACESDTPEGSSSGDFLEGQTWEIFVRRAYTAPTATSSGSYTGTADTTYVVEVVEGGLFSETEYPKIRVTTIDGSDVSGPTVVASSGVGVAIGTKGTLIAFNQTGLVAGSKYYVPVTAEANAGANTILLGNDMDSDATDNADAEVSFYIKSTFEVPRKRDGAPGVYNWTQVTEDGADGPTILEIETNMSAYNAEWTDGGELVALPVFGESTKNYGKLYLTYRAWLGDLCDQIYVIDDVADLDDSISGPLHPDNVLKYAVFKALSNSNGTPVKYTGVCNPADVDSWSAVIEVLNTTDEVYGLVPCTHNGTVIDLFKAHVLDVSTEVHQAWRYLWVNLESIDKSKVVDATLSTDSEVVLATITASDEDVFNTVTITSGNAGFVSLDVRVGDTIRYAYTSDGYDGVTYSEATIESIVNESVAIISHGPEAAVSVGAKIEIWRNLSAGERATAIGQAAGAYNCRRMSAVWPDRIGAGGLTVDGYHLCAALAGLASGVVPQQGLTRLAISGFDDVSRTTKLYTRSQLNTMAGSGVFIVTRDSSGNIFARHALTTAAATEDLNYSEEMVVRNFDDQSYFWRDRFEPYIGISNNTPSMLDIIEAELLSGIQELRQRYYVARLGGQVIDAQIADLRRSPIFRDQMIAELEEEIPYPLNNLDVKQRVVVNLSQSQSRTDR